MNASLFRELISSVVSPFEELVAYEYLYADPKMTLRKMTAMTTGMGRTPSQALAEESGLLDPKASDEYREVERYLTGKVGLFDLLVNGTPSWPQHLMESERPAPVLYYRGSASHIGKPSVSVVGSRNASAEGLALAGRIADQLAEREYGIVTGLARGIDAAATASAIRCGARTVGVIGTPIDEVYPKENEHLFDGIIEGEGLIISQVPFYRYSRQPFKTKRFYFPERNELMAAISTATVIVEASDTSGTLSQARACQYQGRPLFITRHACDSSVSWPLKWAGRPNVHIVEDGNDIARILEGGSDE